MLDDLSEPPDLSESCGAGDCGAVVTVLTLEIAITVYPNLMP